MKKHKVDNREFNSLYQIGFKVHEFKPWHFRISEDGCEMFVDVWPTRKKICVNKNGYFSKSYIYKDLVSEIETIFLNR